MIQRNEKVAELIKELAARFLERESNKTSLVTITGATCSPDLKRGTIFLTVLPDSKEEEVLEFAKRKRSEFRSFLKKSVDMKVIPFIDFEIDRGEKHRQRIDELLRNG